MPTFSFPTRPATRPILRGTSLEWLRRRSLDISPHNISFPRLGFTLVELLVVLAVIAVLLMLSRQWDTATFPILHTATGQTHVNFKAKALAQPPALSARRPSLCTGLSHESRSTRQETWVVVF
jgi:prepilin-type N-terminal cleavage/methylation domain-containing protein